MVGILALLPFSAPVGNALSEKIMALGSAGNYY
jgi:hypothetical protein